MDRRRAACAHAPSVPGSGAGGATGPRVPRRQPGSWSPSSGRPLRASLESLAALLGLTARGCLTAPASAICVPGQYFGLALHPCGLRGHALSLFRRSPARRHCWHLSGNGCVRASWTSSHSLSFQAPAAATVNGEWAHPRPVAGNGPRTMPRRRGSGDKRTASIRCRPVALSFSSNTQLDGDQVPAFAGMTFVVMGHVHNCGTRSQLPSSRRRAGPSTPSRQGAGHLLHTPCCARSLCRLRQAERGPNARRHAFPQ